MARKPRRPALYELIHQKLGLVVSSPSRRTDVYDGPPAESSESWLSPGRSVRIPVGFLFLAGAGVIAVGIISFMIGHRAGGRAMEAQYADRFGGMPMMTPVRDPLTEGADQEEPGGYADGDLRSTVERAEEAATVPVTEPPAPVVIDQRQWGPVESDPRQEDLHYFILATTRTEGARRLAEFCRVNGLEAYVVPSNNSRLRCVTVLPGFETKSGPQVRRMREQIHRIGAMWKARYPVESDLRDAFLP